MLTRRSDEPTVIATVGVIVSRNKAGIFWVGIGWGAVVTIVLALLLGSSLSPLQVILAAAVGFIVTICVGIWHGWFIAKMHPVLGTLVRIPLILIMVGACWSGLAWIAWPVRHFESFVTSTPDPMNSVFSVTLESGPPLDFSDHQVSCYVNEILWGKGATEGNTISEVFRPYGGYLTEGESISDACLGSSELGVSTLLHVGTDPPTCLDVTVNVASITKHGAQKTYNIIYGARYVARHSQGYKWYGQPGTGPKDKSYCEYAIP